MGEIPEGLLCCGEADVVIGVLRDSAVIRHVIVNTASSGSEYRDKQPLPFSGAAVCRFFVLEVRARDIYTGSSNLVWKPELECEFGLISLFNYASYERSLSDCPLKETL